MAKHRCIICGKVRGVRSFKLPHGRIYLCSGTTCRDQITLRINFNSAPVLWVGAEDFTEHEVVCKEAADMMDKDPEIARRVGDAFQSHIWDDDSFGNFFSAALDHIGARLEKQYVLNVPDKDLPLVPMESLKTTAAQACLESRLKGCEPDLDDRF